MTMGLKVHTVSFVPGVNMAMSKALFKETKYRRGSYSVMK